MDLGSGCPACIPELDLVIGAGKDGTRTIKKSSIPSPIAFGKPAEAEKAHRNNKPDWRKAEGLLEEALRDMLVVPLPPENEKFFFRCTTIVQSK
jgi:hypothetical protein